MNNLNYNLIQQSLPLLMQGLATTLTLWLTCSALALGTGFVVGLTRSTRLRQPLLSPALDACTFVLRSVPFYVQLLIAYFVLPDLLGINLSATSAAIVSLGLCSAAYVSQIVRGGINAIPDGQWEACAVLGYTTRQTVWYVIIPQMLRTVVPMLTNELDQLLKSTAIVSSIGVMELTRAGMNVIAREMNPLSMYLTMAVLYVVLSGLLAIVSRLLAKGVAYDMR
jgi:His/Glu/Gln/Arg/opine family amino acid ABC transporter permease subunit